MPICSRCRKRYDDAGDACPQCGLSRTATWDHAAGTIGPLGRFALHVGMALSALGILASMVGGVLYLIHAEILVGAICIGLSAPYAFAMLTVFRYVLDRTDQG